MVEARETAGWALPVDALTIAINTTVDKGGRWYVPTDLLELVCLDLCVAYRSCWNIPSKKVLVSTDARRSVWLRDKSPDARRVPSLPSHVGVMKWSKGILTVLARLSEGQRRVAVNANGKVVKGCMQRLCRVGLGPLWWPEWVMEVTFGDEFNQPIVGVMWPASLQQLSFGCDFNQPIGRVVWPASLQQLSFGHFFNQPIDGVAWSASLQQLSLGWEFDRPIVEVVWPSSLQQLSFGNKFNQPIAGVVWPAFLQQLSFGHSFNQPIAGVVWPTLLQHLSFGHAFNQLLTEVEWPTSLHNLFIDQDSSQEWA